MFIPLLFILSAQVFHQISVGIRDTGTRHSPEWYFVLPSGLSQEISRKEKRGGALYLCLGICGTFDLSCGIIRKKGPFPH